MHPTLTCLRKLQSLSISAIEMTKKSPQRRRNKRQRNVQLHALLRALSPSPPPYPSILQLPPQGKIPQYHILPQAELVYEAQ